MSFTRAKNTAGLFLLIAGGGAAILTGACKKPSATVSQHDRRSPPESNGSTSVIIDEERDHVAIVRREQLELRADLQDELDDVEKTLRQLDVDVRPDAMAPKPKSAKSAKSATRVANLLARRQQLVTDMTLLDRSDDSDWEELKGHIERDLTTKRGRI